MTLINSNALMKGFVLILVTALIGVACNSNDEVGYAKFSGKTMGTTYSVSVDGAGGVFEKAIDSILLEVNMALSTYIPESTISQFNTNGELRMSGQDFRQDPWSHALSTHFRKNLLVAKSVYQKSNGAFDPTVAPLVNRWGFGWEGKAPELPDSTEIDSILGLVGMQHILINEENDTMYVKRDHAGVTLDFSALAKGYGVDVVCDYLTEQGVINYFVEIGGEVRTSGVSQRGDHWRVGINQPEVNSSVSDLYTQIAISNGSVATSGNYRNYYEVDGKRVWHTINPKTGYPESNPLLSATIVHENCMIADALATTCMVMGPKKGIELVEAFNGAEAFILYYKDDEIAEVMTSGFDQYLNRQQ